MKYTSDQIEGLCFGESEMSYQQWCTISEHPYCDQIIRETEKALKLKILGWVPKSVVEQHIIEGDPEHFLFWVKTWFLRKREEN
jgi:hypothetical protein